MNKLVFKLFYQKQLAIALAIAIFAAGCNITGNASKNIEEKAEKFPEAYFCPIDDCGKVFEKLIDSANSSVHCAIYNANLKNVIRSLSKKSKDAEVMVVLDQSNNKELLKGDGVRYNNGGQLMHNKFCVIDEKTVVTGSFNPTSNDNYLNNNNVVVFYSRILARNYEDEFKELWNGEFGKGKKVANPVVYLNGTKIENYFCPEDECSSHVVDSIRAAKKSVYFMAFTFTNEKIADELVLKNDLDIRGIFDAKQAASKFSQLDRLLGFSMKVKKDSNKYTMHHKVFIIDNETVVTGSFNPTESADEKNDENIVIIHNKQIAKLFLKEFDGLWSQ